MLNKSGRGLTGVNKNKMFKMCPIVYKHNMAAINTYSTANKSLSNLLFFSDQRNVGNVLCGLICGMFIYLGVISVTSEDVIFKPYQ